MKKFFALALVTLAASASFAHDVDFQGEFINNTGTVLSGYDDAGRCREAGGRWVNDFDSGFCRFSQSNRLSVYTTKNTYILEVFSRTANLEDGDICFLNGPAKQVALNQLEMTTGTADATCKVTATYKNDYTAQVEFEGACSKTCSQLGSFWVTRNIIH